MCGIIGYIGPKDSFPILMEGLQRLEYRGYDSAGIALIAREGEGDERDRQANRCRLRVYKRRGKLRELEAALPTLLKGVPGIGHTRWATHGEPSDRNAHPHTDSSGSVAIVHNGILENAAELRARLVADGVVLRSETDSEVLAHLIGRALASGTGQSVDLEGAVRIALRQVEGTYGLAVICTQQPDRIVVARNGGPVILGIGEHEMFVASDIAALVRYTQRVIHLDDREMAIVRCDAFRTHTLDATPTQKQVTEVPWKVGDLDKGVHDHFMQKEIFEQPEVVERALRGRFDDRFCTARLGGVTITPREALGIRRIKILGCGSAFYAGLAGAQLLEALTRIPADAEPASEFRYRNPVVESDVLYLAVSQSGETADTLAAIQELKRKGGRVLALVNVVGSTIAREVDGIYLHAGPEVSVASTKVFTSILVSFSLLGLYLGRIRDLGPADGRRLIEGLRALPTQIRQVLELEASIASVAAKYASRRSMLFVGRNTGYPIALEGAQKLKEISYIHAEAYPASELKHGPLALVGPEIPTVALLPNDPLFEKNVSSVQQIRARSGPVIAVTQSHLDSNIVDDVLLVPQNLPELAPILLTIPLQLFAYHTAISLGRDVDQPRNLAKSVTVE